MHGMSRSVTAHVQQQGRRLALKGKQRVAVYAKGKDGWTLMDLFNLIIHAMLIISRGLFFDRACPKLQVSTYAETVQLRMPRRTAAIARPREQVCKAQAKERQLDGVASWKSKHNENHRNFSQSALLASTWSP